MTTEPTHCAFFSTNGGRHPPRSVTKGIMPPPVIHSSPARERDAYIKSLRAMYPHETYGIFAKSSEGHKKWDIRWFFDEYDLCTKGGAWLYDVILTMQIQNEEFVKRYVNDWAEQNRGKWPISIPNLDWNTAFCDQDKQVFGPEFLKKALLYMKSKWQRTVETQRQIDSSHWERQPFGHHPEQQRMFVYPSPGVDMSGMYPIPPPFAHPTVLHPEDTISKTSEAPPLSKVPSDHLSVAPQKLTSPQRRTEQRSNVVEQRSEVSRPRSELPRTGRDSSNSSRGHQRHGSHATALSSKPVFSSRFNVSKNFIGPDVDHIDQIFIGGIQEHITEDDVRQSISRFCEVQHISFRYYVSQSKVSPLRNALVTVPSTEDVRILVELGTLTCKDSSFSVQVSRRFHSHFVPGSGMVSDYQQHTTHPRHSFENSRGARSSHGGNAGNHSNHVKSLYSPQDARSTLKQRVVYHERPEADVTCDPPSRIVEKKENSVVSASREEKLQARSLDVIQEEQAESVESKMPKRSVELSAFEKLTPAVRPLSLAPAPSSPEDVPGVQTKAQALLEKVVRKSQTLDTGSNKPILSKNDDGKSAVETRHEGSESVNEVSNLPLTEGKDSKQPEKAENDAESDIKVFEPTKESSALVGTLSPATEKGDRVQTEAGPQAACPDPTMDQMGKSTKETGPSEKLMTDSIEHEPQPKPETEIQGLDVTLTTAEKLSDEADVRDTPALQYPPRPKNVGETPMSLKSTMELKNWSSIYQSILADLEKLPPNERKSWTDQFHAIQAELLSIEEKYADCQVKLISGGKTMKKSSRAKSKQAVEMHSEKWEELILLRERLSNDLISFSKEQDRNSRYPTFNRTSASLELEKNPETPKCPQWPFVTAPNSPYNALRVRKSSRPATTSKDAFASDSFNTMIDDGGGNFSSFRHNSIDELLAAEQLLEASGEHGLGIRSEGTAFPMHQVPKTENLPSANTYYGSEGGSTSHTPIEREVADELVKMKQTKMSYAAIAQKVPATVAQNDNKSVVSSSSGTQSSVSTVQGDGKKKYQVKARSDIESDGGKSHDSKKGKGKERYTTGPSGEWKAEGDWQQQGGYRKDN